MQSFWGGTERLTLLGGCAPYSVHLMQHMPSFPLQLLATGRPRKGEDRAGAKAGRPSSHPY